MRATVFVALLYRMMAMHRPPGRRLLCSMNGLKRCCRVRVSLPSGTQSMISTPLDKVTDTFNVIIENEALAGSEADHFAPTICDLAWTPACAGMTRLEGVGA